MYFFYSVLLTLGIIALLPRFIYDAFRHGKYIAGFRQRLGKLPQLETNGRGVIWLHCVSVGEVLAARPLARALLERNPSRVLVVSTTTLTGQQVASDAFRDLASAVFYFPFDWAWTVRRALKSISPSAVLIMETELWPNFLRECRRRAISTAIVNGRISERSFSRYKLVSKFARRIVNDLDLALMQTQSDAERILGLGLAPERVLVSGNIKFDIDYAVAERPLTAELRTRFHFTSKNNLIVAASTHQPEERVVLETFKLIRAKPGLESIRLIIVPRHPERFDEVAALLESSGYRWSRRSAPEAENDSKCDVLLLDSIGELNEVYPLARVVFVGGSIARTGGHNILEPAGAGVCVITGHHTFNFKDVVEAFLKAQAIVQLPDLCEREVGTALATELQRFLVDDQLALKSVENAKMVLENNRGATARTIRMLSPLIDEISMTDQPHVEAVTPDSLSA